MTISSYWLHMIRFADKLRTRQRNSQSIRYFHNDIFYIFEIDMLWSNLLCVAIRWDVLSLRRTHIVLWHVKIVIYKAQFHFGRYATKRYENLIQY